VKDAVEVGLFWLPVRDHMLIWYV